MQRNSIDNSACDAQYSIVANYFEYFTIKKVCYSYLHKSWIYYKKNIQRDIMECKVVLQCHVTQSWKMNTGLNILIQYSYYVYNS